LQAVILLLDEGIAELELGTTEELLGTATLDEEGITELELGITKMLDEESTTELELKTTEELLGSGSSFSLELEL